MVQSINIAGLLAIFQDIFNQSTLIDGRFACLSSGADINSTNFSQLVTDAFSGLTEKSKYPAAIMLPPSKIKKNDQKGMARYKFRIFFLVLDKRNTGGDIKNADLQTNISLQGYQQDWNDVNIIADQFFMAFFQYCQAGQITPIVHEDRAARSTYFLTKTGNDRINGCHVDFEVSMFEGDNCNALTDYANPITVNVTDFSPNTLNLQ